MPFGSFWPIPALLRQPSWYKATWAAWRVVCKKRNLGIEPVLLMIELQMSLCVQPAEAITMPPATEPKL